jgi:hypothetical protein
MWYFSLEESLPYGTFVNDVEWLTMNTVEESLKKGSVCRMGFTHLPKSAELAYRCW